MITDTSDRFLYIGGSEANMIYMNYHTKTFREWWYKKLEKITEEIPTNQYMEVGTILEEAVIDLYERLNNVKGIRSKQAIKGIARANTDYIQGDKVSDVKVTKHASEWHKKGRVPIHYKRQLIHYCYVLGLNKASIIAYQTNNNLINNPFQELDEDNLYEIEVPITSKEIEIHRQKLEYLEFCRDMNVFPE